MALAALSPNSVMSNPVQVNPKVSTDLQANVPQTAQDAQKSVKSAQTDTVTISPQALKLADDKNAAAREVAKDQDDRQASKSSNDQASAARRAVQQSAQRSYVTFNSYN